MPAVLFVEGVVGVTLDVRFAALGQAYMTRMGGQHVEVPVPNLDVQEDLALVARDSR